MAGVDAGDDRAVLAARVVELEARAVVVVAERDQLRVEVERLRRANAELEARVEQLRRAAKRQAAPFSRDKPATHPRPGGRRPGVAYGIKARRLFLAPEQVDEVVDEVVDVGLPGSCPGCGGAVVVDSVACQFQEELARVVTRMRRYDVCLGHCTTCKRAVRGRHPEQTSDALGAAGVVLGPRVVALAAWLHVGLGVPVAKVARILEALGGVRVTPGGVQQALHRLAGDAERTYQALLASLRGSVAVSADETGWRVGGRRAWLWAYVGDHASVYDIAAGRGYDQAVAVLGADFAGVLERDGWAPYRRFVHANHQSCLAHLLRRTREMLADARAGQAKVPHALRRILRDALAVRDAGLDGPAAADEIARLEQRIEAFCRRAPSFAPNRRLVAHVRREAPHLLTFLTIDGVQATNWEAEHALRAMIGNRKQWGGNKTTNGATTTAVLGSVLRTSAQQHADPVQVLTGIQHDGKAASQLILPGPAP